MWGLIWPPHYTVHDNDSWSLCHSITQTPWPLTIPSLATLSADQNAPREVDLSSYLACSSPHFYTVDYSDIRSLCHGTTQMPWPLGIPSLARPSACQNALGEADLSPYLACSNPHLYTILQITSVSPCHHTEQTPPAPISPLAGNAIITPERS